MKKILSVAILLLLIVSMVMPLGASASSAYQTYTYSIDGEALYSPDAYSAVSFLGYADLGMDVNFKDPGDLVTDGDLKVYVADSGNNRIVVLSRYYEYQFAISTFVNAQGNNDSLSNPQGVFVVDDKDAPTGGYIWVCDTDKNRLVEFDKEGNFVKTVDAPESQLFDEGDIYKPVAMAIDQYGRIFVVSSTTYQGIIVMNAEGEFVGFIGAQAVTISAWEILWRKFQTEEQKKLSQSYISTEYNNITINEDGFVYVTTSTISESSVSSAIQSKSTDGTYLPVKLLNPAGDEIMRRNGFWPPAGEIDYSNSSKAEYSGVSTVTDVAVGPEKTWSIIDSKRNKIYTYDFNGNLLFAFGDKGSMLGSIGNIEAVCYQDTNMLVLDRAGQGGIIVYERTQYGNLLLNAIAAENDLDYSYAISCWEDVLQRNSNFDAAYVGIGNAYYRKGDYAQALKYYETAYETESWSDSYKMVRKQWMSKFFIPLLLGIIALLVAIVKFFQWAGKVNKAVAINGQARKTFGQELLYGFYVIFHPFDGFYDLKHEHRGSVRAATFYLVLTVVAFFYNGIGQGYVLNPRGEVTSIWTQIISVLVPFFLFVLGNWCLTTLFDGEGSFKDIYIAVGYSLLPVIMTVIPATLVSNWLTSAESTIVTFVITIGYIWLGFLAFFGTMTTHDYSLGKNFITILGTVVAMVFIIFVVLLFSMLLAKLVSLVTNIVTELQYRM